jgi:hypothetical protein
VVQRIQHAHDRRRRGDHAQKREHDARQLHGQLELPRHAREVPRVHMNQRTGEDDAEDDERAGRDEQGVQDVVPEPPCRVLTLESQLPCKGGHEGRTHRALREQIAHQIRDAERDHERIHVVAGAEEGGEDLIAAQPEDAARERRRAGHACVPREAVTSSARRAVSGSGQRVRFHREPRA